MDEPRTVSPAAATVYALLPALLLVLVPISPIGLDIALVVLLVVGSAIALRGPSWGRWFTFATTLAIAVASVRLLLVAGTSGLESSPLGGAMQAVTGGNVVIATGMFGLALGGVLAWALAERRCRAQAASAFVSFAAVAGTSIALDRSAAGDTSIATIGVALAALLGTVAAIPAVFELWRGARTPPARSTLVALAVAAVGLALVPGMPKLLLLGCAALLALAARVAGRGTRARARARAHEPAHETP